MILRQLQAIRILAFGISAFRGGVVFDSSNKVTAMPFSGHQAHASYTSAREWRVRLRPPVHVAIVLAPANTMRR